VEVFVFFLHNFDQIIHIHHYKWCLFNRQKYSKKEVISRNILLSSLFPKRGELIFGQVATYNLKVAMSHKSWHLAGDLRVVGLNPHASGDLLSQGYHKISTKNEGIICTLMF